jgi:uncharacterized protein (DUF362 family)
MEVNFTRRHLLRLAAGAGAIASPVPLSRALLGQTAASRTPSGLPEPVYINDRQATVSLVKGDERRKNITAALEAIDDQIRPRLAAKKYVVIKPNDVMPFNQLAATHADALRGILDYLEPRFKGPVVIAESSAGDTLSAFESFRYERVVKEYPGRQIRLVDLNAEPQYKTMPLLSGDLHVQPVRLAARLFDPDAFIICSAILKTHNVCVATLSIKNMCLGAPLHSLARQRPFWSDKRKYHGGVRQTHYNIMLTAQLLAPFWGVAVIDGFEGMEGSGPASGTPVPSRLAIASTDFVAADRVAIETMGINPLWMATQQYCWQVGLGQYDLAKIDVRGEAIASLRRTYRLHNDIDRELQWMGPLTEIPPKLG